MLSQPQRHGWLLNHVTTEQPCCSHVHRSHTQSYTRRHIQSHITDGKETFGQKEAACAPGERDKDMQKCAVISRNPNVRAHNWAQHVLFRHFFRHHTHTHFCKDRHELYSTPLSLSLVLSTLRNSERQKNMSCKRDPIVPWREQMEPPTNNWALHSLAFLKKKKHRHKQQHWLCSPIMHLCFYIHSGVLTKMWGCPCAFLQAEIQLCVTNACWARHGNPQTELVHTPPRYRLLNASPSSRSQSAGLKIP